MKSTLTDTARKITAMEVVVDKMHFKGYTHQWCRLHCNSNDFDKLAKVCIFTQSLHACHLLTAYHLDCGQVDTEICKQTFSWLSRYARITRHMNKPHFMFYCMFVIYTIGKNFAPRIHIYHSKCTMLTGTL